MRESLNSINRKIKRIVFTCIVLSFAAAIIMYFISPGRIAAHLDSNGSPDRLGNRIELVLSPIILGICQLAFIPFWRMIAAMHTKPSSQPAPEAKASKTILGGAIAVSATLAAVSVFANLLAVIPML